MSKFSRFAASAVPALAVAICAAPVAHAATSATALPQAIAAASLSSALPCLQPALTKLNLAQSGMNLAQAKSTAILGGKLSKLELMRLNQSGQPTSQAALATTALTSLAPAQSSGIGDTCISNVTGQIVTSFIQPNSLPEAIETDNFLASKRLRISRTTFDSEWNRVQRQGLGRATVARFLGSTIGGPSEATLAKVNAWTNHRVRFAEDRDIYGRGDYWASASVTLKRRAGDCEDIAIAKMHLLAALGVPRSDMYLTVARDLARNADHAMLVVKLGDRYWLLDNATDKLLDGLMNHDYRPIMSFSSTGKWLHGYVQS